MTNENHLQQFHKLIKEGEMFEITSRLSGSISNYDQVDYIAWHHQVFFQLKSIDPLFFNIVGQLENEEPICDNTHPYVIKILGTLKGALGILESQQIFNPRIETASDNKLSFSENKVFIVHGHDTGLLHEVARYITDFDIEPIILQEQIGNGQTIIEKFETYSDVKFAIVLLTSDDVGKSVSEEDFKPRARQNVILELGYFFGKLGRANVRALYDEKVELPSDLIGIEYIKIDGSNGWKLKLAREMKQSGLKIDMNNIGHF